jgi:hypothetical protein
MTTSGETGSEPSRTQVCPARRPTIHITVAVAGRSAPWALPTVARTLDPLTPVPSPTVGHRGQVHPREAGNTAPRRQELLTRPA